MRSTWGTCVAVMVLVAGVSGCSGDGGGEAVVEPVATGTEPTETEPEDIGGEETETEEAEAREEPATETNWTAELVEAGAGQPWVDEITSAVETEPGRMEIATTIVDPRGDDGSPQAQQAIAVCEAAVGLLAEGGAETIYVSVFEEDGTHFVLYGHPTVPDGECTEI